MARLLLSLLLFSTSCIAIAQDGIRLLYDRYASAKGQEKAKLANQLCQQMKEKDETDSLYRFDKSDKTMDFIILKSMANHYMVCNNNDSALSFCKRAISIYKTGLCEEEYAEMEYCCHSEIALVSFGHCLSVPGSFSLLRREGCEAFNAV